MTQSKTQKAALTPAENTTPVTVKVACPTKDEVKIYYEAGADSNAMTDHALSVLKEICAKACISSVKVTSTARTVEDQARIMREMIAAKGTKYVKNLYGAGGQSVVAAYETATKKKLSESEVQKAMVGTINDVGPENVSNHITRKNGPCVFDVAPSSISDSLKKQFVREVKANASVSRFFEPPKDPAYHLEIKNP